MALAQSKKYPYTVQRPRKRSLFLLRNHLPLCHAAYLDYKFVDPFAVRFGQYKLPLSRSSLSSSARQLIVERPFSSEDAKGLFGDYEQVELMLHGSVAGGIFKYMLAAADGSEPSRHRLRQYGR